MVATCKAEISKKFQPWKLTRGTAHGVLGVFSRFQPAKLLVLPVFCGGFGKIARTPVLQGR